MWIISNSWVKNAAYCLFPGLKVQETLGRMHWQFIFSRLYCDLHYIRPLRWCRNVCQLAKADTDFIKPNSNLKSANCCSQQNTRFLDCPYLQQCKEAVRKMRSTNIVHQEALHSDEAAKGQASQVNKRLQDQVMHLKEQVSKIKKQRNEAATTKLLALRKQRKHA